MKRIKHSKFKNTGILFELLTRQITVEILDGDKTHIARKLVSEFFGKTTELNKELRLYELLIKERYNKESRAEKFVDMVTEAYTKLNRDKLQREKYNLIKQIKENFDLDKFLSSSISNYKLLASIYKVFESKVIDEYDIKDAFNSKVTLIEHIVQRPMQGVNKLDDPLIEYYKKQDKDLRLLAYKIMVETFNKRYSTLDVSQRNMLREYINNVTNTSKFKDYVTTELPNIVKELRKLETKINDKVTRIKLAETATVLENMKLKKTISDKQVSGIMMSYELIKELKERLNEKK